ncbi:glyoxylase-like metal-dependent hydrolase (beta-lactamase superfamily II) [Georgenia soli]|uniref:Glyoxylase-like metal-dependent hydrolase (Beta-lactamase superfamily II) n=1 Tax=Georgenia soli TaxID=638953 RepID=A0A2A9ESE8_9MICO|nr:MBL fold metallo-hydrolase [Georgenia soli]PFG41192.1 glyoxylase-like metal-dependent hydrolase (beta-lactamase superfamily II) [Georgenia soli]
MTATTWTGGRLSARGSCVLAPNPGVMTLEGTNTWLLREPGSTEVAVVDPGPDDAGHLERVLTAAGADGGRVAVVLLTHHHRDHTGAAGALAARTGAPVHGAGHRPLADGETLEVGGLAVQVLATPGHTADSVSFLLPSEGLLLTGDTVLGRGTTVLAWPDGTVGDYLRTVDTLLAAVRDGRVTRLAPGHGPPVEDPAGVLTALRQHRVERLQEVRAAVQGGADDVDEVVTAVYGPHLGADRRRAAALSVRAQLDHLGIVLEGEPA